MKNRTRFVLFSSITMLVFLVNLAVPVAAYADDSNPPDASPPASAPAATTPDSASTAAAPAADTTAAPPAAATDTATTEAAPATDTAPVDLPTVLEQAPADTQVVVVNDVGQAEPLATVKAAEILQTGDPVWCPGASVPGSAGCTGSHLTLADLVTDLSSGSYSGPGTIWVESTYAGDSSAVGFDHNVMSGLSDLTLQSYGGLATVNVPLGIFNWSGSVTVNNLDFSVDDLSTALSITTDGTIGVNTVSVKNVSGSGASLDSSSDITVTNSTFDGNAGNGLAAYSNGNITLNTVSASNTTGTGAYLNSCLYNGSTCDGTGGITVANSTFNNNSSNGLTTDSGADTTLTNVTADNNNAGSFSYALDDSTTLHNVTVNGGSFSGNVNTGLEVRSDGDVALNGITADSNKAGAMVHTNTSIYNDATPGTGSITVTGGEFDGNAWDGLDAWSAGNIIIQNTAEFSGNLEDGAYLDATYGTGTIAVSDSTFNSNGNTTDGRTHHGLFAVADNNITLTNLTVDGGNVTDVGAWIKAINGTATVQNSSFKNNTETGLTAIGGKEVDLINLDVTTNTGDGAQIYSTFTYACFGTTGILVNVVGGAYTTNGLVPLIIKPGPDGTVTVSGTPTFDVGESMVIDLGNPCIGNEEEKPVEGKPVEIVEVPFKGGEPVQEDCTDYSSTVLELPDGTWVKFRCPFEGYVKLEGLLENELPGPLGAGSTFVSAITYGMTDLQNAAITVNPDGTITIKFKIPEDSKARSYDILYWDPTANNGTGAWITLPPYKKFDQQPVPLNPNDPEDKRMVTRGVKQQGEYVTVTVNFTGTFVLVAR